MSAVVNLCPEQYTLVTKLRGSCEGRQVYMRWLLAQPNQGHAGVLLSESWVVPQLNIVYTGSTAASAAYSQEGGCLTASLTEGEKSGRRDRTIIESSCVRERPAWTSASASCELSSVARRPARARARPGATVLVARCVVIARHLRQLTRCAMISAVVVVAPVRPNHAATEPPADQRS